MLKRLSFLTAIFIISFFSGCGSVKYITEEPQRSLSIGEEAQLQVLAAGDWRNSGVMLRKGEKYKVTASGKWQIGGTCNPTGPDGIGVYAPFCWDIGGQLVPGFTQAALIAKIGNNGIPFGVGESFEMVAERDDFIFFRSNDNMLGDNKGFLNVSIRKISGEGLSLPTGETIVKHTSIIAERSRIAVLGLKPTTKGAADEGYGDMVSEMLITGLIKTGRYEVLERSQIKQILSERQFSEVDVVVGESAVTAGRMLRVKYLVIGSVAKIQNLTEVDVRFIDTETGKALLAENASCQSMGDLRNAINQLINKITTGYPGKL